MDCIYIKRRNHNQGFNAQVIRSNQLLLAYSEENMLLSTVLAGASALLPVAIAHQCGTDHAAPSPAPTQAGSLVVAFG